MWLWVWLCFPFDWLFMFFILGWIIILLLMDDNKNIVIMCGKTKMCPCICVHGIFWKNWKKNIISKVPKDGDLKDHVFQALKATMFKSIECEEGIEDFVGCTWEKLLMTIMEDFGGIGFHNYFWGHYDIRFGKCAQFTFYFWIVYYYIIQNIVHDICIDIPKLTLNIL